MEGAEVAEPGEAGGQAGESEKEEGAAVQRAEFAMLAEGEGDAPGKDHDYSGADGGGEVGVDMGDADLGEQGGGGGEDCGEYCPCDPAHANHGTRHPT